MSDRDVQAARGQLSMIVEPDVRLGDYRDDDENPVMSAEINLSGSLRVYRDLQPGHKLTVSVSDSSGEVIAAGTFEVETPSFPAVKFKGTVLGHKRVVSLSCFDGDLLAPTEFGTADPRGEA